MFNFSFQQRALAGSEESEVCGSNLWSSQEGAGKANCKQVKTAGTIAAFKLSNLLSSLMGPLAVAGIMDTLLNSGKLNMENLAASLGTLAAAAAAEEAATGLGGVVNSVASGHLNVTHDLRKASIGAGVSAVTGSVSSVTGSLGSQLGQQISTVGSTQAAVDQAFGAASNASNGTLYSGNVSNNTV